MKRPGWGRYEAVCAHPQTTVPDADGYVVCCECLLAIRRPLTQEQLNQKLLGR